MSIVVASKHVETGEGGPKALNTGPAWSRKTWPVHNACRLLYNDRRSKAKDILCILQQSPPTSRPRHFYPAHLPPSR